MSVIMNVLNTARREGTEKKRIVPQVAPEMEKETIQIGQSFTDKLNALQESSVNAIEHLEYPKYAMAGNSTPSILNQQVKRAGLFSKIIQSASREMFFGFFVFAILCASVLFFGSKMATVPTASSPSNTERLSVSNTPVRGTFSRSLQGVILGDGQDPYCILDGDLLRVGDAWRGSKITAISNKGVSLTQLNGTPILLTNQALK
jgi:hypothetical protein